MKRKIVPMKNKAKNQTWPAPAAWLQVDEAARKSHTYMHKKKNLRKKIAAGPFWTTPFRHERLHMSATEAGDTETG